MSHLKYLWTIGFLIFVGCSTEEEASEVSINSQNAGISYQNTVLSSKECTCTLTYGCNLFVDGVFKKKGETHTLRGSELNRVEHFETWGFSCQSNGLVRESNNPSTDLRNNQTTITQPNNQIRSSSEIPNLGLSDCANQAVNAKNQNSILWSGKVENHCQESSWLKTTDSSAAWNQPGFSKQKMIDDDSKFTSGRSSSKMDYACQCNQPNGCSAIIKYGASIFTDTYGAYFWEKGYNSLGFCKKY